jgi:hypothetical protein
MIGRANRCFMHTSMNLKNEVRMGSTGYQPVPSGHWPDGIVGRW